MESEGFTADRVDARCHFRSWRTIDCLQSIKAHMAFLRRGSPVVVAVLGRRAQGSRSRTRSPTTVCDPGAHGFPGHPPFLTTCGVDTLLLRATAQVSRVNGRRGRRWWSVPINLGAALVMTRSAKCREIDRAPPRRRGKVIFAANHAATPLRPTPACLACWLQTQTFADRCTGSQPCAAMPQPEEDADGDGDVI